MKITLPAAKPNGPAQYIVEAMATTERRHRLCNWLDRQRCAGARTFHVTCNLERTGLWAGLAELLEETVLEALNEAPELVQRHARELMLILPKLQRTLEAPNLSLTDVAVPEEKVRNYPMDRAYRIIHGMIDFFSEWHLEQNRVPLVIVCDGFDEAGALVSMFFRELLRRRGRALKLTLVLAVKPAKGERIQLADGVSSTTVQWELAEEEPTPPDPSAMEERALEIEARGENDLLVLRENLPELIYCWRHSNHPEKALVWVGFAFSEYNHFGFYEDALPYGLEILDNLEVMLASETPFTRWNLVGALTNCYLALGQPEKALEVAETEGLAKVEQLEDRSRILYVLALIHSRFLSNPDFARAESYIARGLEVIEEAEIPEHEKWFQRVFLQNGLAYIRYRQKQSGEALELCRYGYKMLEEHLPPNRHRLHRSVLLYNMAQVYAALEEWDDAIKYLTATIELDPNYSEYYNERGIAYFNLGRLDEAIADYKEAIERSAPYQEVWTNLGQAYKRAGRFNDAVRAYSQALDLEHHQLLPRLGRAQAYDALNCKHEALGDYSAALERNPDLALALANRASLWYELGDLEQATEDLDRAVELLPENAGLLYNRSRILTDLGRNSEAIADLETFLSLQPDAENRQQVEAQISLLAEVSSAGKAVRMEHAVGS